MRIETARTLRQKKTSKAGSVTYTIETGTSALQETFTAIRDVVENLPRKDNEAGAVEKMLQANAILRNAPWPAPFDETAHRLQIGDARDLSFLESESVHLIVTSPPYWTLKKYEYGNNNQLG